MKLSRAVIKKMLVAGYGSIVTTASAVASNEATSWGSDHASFRCEYGDYGHYRHIRQIGGGDIVLD